MKRRAFLKLIAASPFVVLLPKQTKAEPTINMNLIGRLAYKSEGEPIKFINPSAQLLYGESPAKYAIEDIKKVNYYWQSLIELINKKYEFVFDKELVKV